MTPHEHKHCGVSHAHADQKVTQSVEFYSQPLARHSVTALQEHQEQSGVSRVRKSVDTRAHVRAGCTRQAHALQTPTCTHAQLHCNNIHAHQTHAHAPAHMHALTYARRNACTTHAAHAHVGSLDSPSASAMSVRRLEVVCAIPCCTRDAASGAHCKESRLWHFL